MTVIFFITPPKFLLFTYLSTPEFSATISTLFQWEKRQVRWSDFIGFTRILLYVFIVFHLYAAVKKYFSFVLNQVCSPIAPERFIMESRVSNVSFVFFYSKNVIKVQTYHLSWKCRYLGFIFCSIASLSSETQFS